MQPPAAASAANETGAFGSQIGHIRFRCAAHCLFSDKVHDLSTLEAGDEVGVDFFVPEEGDDRLEAASMWKP
jgi:hypothetical protein